MIQNIIGTGSTGNSVQINNLLFDVGLPFKKIKPYLYDVQYIIITHIHSDHLNLATAKHIRLMFPDIIFIANEQVNSKFPVDVVAEAGQPLKLGNTTLTPFYAPHDVLVYGYTWVCDNENYIYVTDTNSLRNAPTREDNGGYDYMFVEANHDKNKIQAIMNNNQKGYKYDVVAGALRHLSTQSAMAWVFMNRRNKDSKWIRLHQSSRFY